MAAKEQLPKLTLMWLEPLMDKISKLGIACSMWHTSMKAFYRKQQDRFSFGEMNNRITKNWSAYLDKNVTMEEHCKAKSAYMIDMETSNNDMTHMCWCDSDSGAYTAGEILVEEGIAEHYEVLYDDAAYWPNGQDLFAMNRESFEFVNGMAYATENKTVLWLYLTQEGTDFFTYREETAPKGMEDLE